MLINHTGSIVYPKNSKSSGFKIWNIEYYRQINSIKYFKIYISHTKNRLLIILIECCLFLCFSPDIAHRGTGRWSYVPSMRHINHTGRRFGAPRALVPRGPRYVGLQVRGESICTRGCPIKTWEHRKFLSNFKRYLQKLWKNFRFDFVNSSY